MLLNLDKISPDRIAAKDTDGNILTYGEIISLAEKIKESIPKRSLFFIKTVNNVGGIAWVMATIISGNVPLILNAHTEESLYNNLLNTYLPEYIVTPNSMCSQESDSVLHNYGYKLQKSSLEGKDLEGEKKSPLIGGDLEGGITYPPVRGDQGGLNPLLSHLLPTSGSTGSPKLVRHKYENIEAAALNISTLFRLTDNDHPLMVLPLYYTMGLSMVFSHLKVGATILITDRKMTDSVFWKFLKDEKATSFTGVPFSYEVLDKMRFYRMNLPELTLLTQGGGKMPEDLNRKFVDYCISNGKRWIATYGQSEGTARMAWLPEEYALSKLGSIGIAVPNGRLSLRDSEGKEIEKSPATGEMCYEGKNVTMGYAICREDLGKGDERNGFLPTGDIAYRDEDGFYFIKGRMGRFLKLFGNRVGLDESEHILKSHISCECACVGTDDKMIVYITDGSQKDIALNSLIEAIKVPANVIEIRVIESLPKNEAGKILYAQLSNT